MRRANTQTIDILETLTLTELSHFCHVQDKWVMELVDCGVLEPLGAKPAEWRFSPPNVLRARNARHLTLDQGLNLAGVALALDLIEERDALARKLAQLSR